ncbi:hypothetical protein DICVIV_04363 [Dictyocaulus viviparus]|uniref:Uncharacterized protein n=1 Tax=Dictyocaulus viviparus TaxID=29172 RepID=A0A0D8Y0C8_DICVI|nr:hypothetical protein DICVIV_04363 [Dictyocaulus viviparus]
MYSTNVCKNLIGLAYWMLGYGFTFGEGMVNPYIGVGDYFFDPEREEQLSIEESAKKRECNAHIDRLDRTLQRTSADEIDVDFHKIIEALNGRKDRFKVV